MCSAEPLLLLREQLVRLAQYRIGDPHAAQDIAQETLTRVLESRQSFTRAAHLTGWAVTTTKNLCADHHRQQRRLTGRPGEQPSTGWVASTSWPVGEAADAFTLSRDLVDSILEALATMPDRQAHVLLTAARLGSTDRTTLAAATGETESAVRNYLHRGRAALRSKLAAAGQGAFGLQPVWNYLRSSTHRRVVAAGLLVPVLSLLTVLLALPALRHDATGQSTGVGDGSATRPRPTLTPAPLGTTPALPVTAWEPPTVHPEPAHPVHVVATSTSQLPVRLLRYNGDVCGVDAADKATVAPTECGFDLSNDTYIGFWAAGFGVGVYEPNVRCHQVPSVPGVVCRDPSPSPSPSPRTAGS